MLATTDHPAGPRIDSPSPAAISTPPSTAPTIAFGSSSRHPAATATTPNPSSTLISSVPVSARPSRASRSCSTV